MATDKKINYEMQGKVKNYLGKQKMVKAPLHWQSGEKHPSTELAYITKKEKDLLIKKDLHKSLKGGVNRGPSGIMSLNGWGDRDEGFADKSYGGQEKPGTTSTVDRPNPHTVSGSSPTTVTTKTVSPKDHFEQSWSGPKGWFGTGGYKDLKVAGDTSPGHKSRWGGLGRGLLSLFGGIPGKVISGVMGLKNFGKHKTLSDWYKSTQGGGEEEEEFTSDYQINPTTGKYEYVGGSMEDTMKEFRQKHPLNLSNVNQNVNFGNNVSPFPGYTGTQATIPENAPSGIDESALAYLEGKGIKFNQGGRIGYRNGEFVDENINVEGPGFDVNENVEMAAGDDPVLEEYQKYLFEMEEQGLEPMSFEQFKAEAMMAEGESDQGLASLV